MERTNVVQYQHMEIITIESKQSKEVVDITDELQRVVGGYAGHADGVLTAHVSHTTAALTTADLDPGGTDEDFLNAFGAIIPGNETMDYNHPHNPEHMPDHILSTIIGTNVSIPLKQGKMALGTWQHVVLFEFDGPRERSVAVSVVTESS